MNIERFDNGPFLTEWFYGSAKSSSDYERLAKSMALARETMEVIVGLLVDKYPLSLPVGDKDVDGMCRAFMQNMISCIRAKEVLGRENEKNGNAS